MEFHYYLWKLQVLHLRGKLLKEGIIWGNILCSANGKINSILNLTT